MKKIKMMCLLLSLTILYQSCRVYQHKSVSLDKAVKEGKRVKIKTKDDKTFKFKKVVYEDGEYYGVKKRDEKILLNNDLIKKVRLHNKTMSIIYGILVGYVSALALGFTYWSLAGGLDIGSGFAFPN